MWKNKYAYEISRFVKGSTDAEGKDEFSRIVDSAAAHCSKNCRLRTSSPR